MKTKKQYAKFFCENCGAEVPENARICKRCGRFFSSVRCPKCGTSGPASMFEKGCPHCGYAMNNIQTISYIEHNSNRKKNISLSKKKKIRRIMRTYMNKKSSMSQNDNSLPIWIYIITATILALIIAAIYSCIK
ncbi:MAG: zinc ribbon domain-containing protein [Treponema sp.]|nr:zinc ribbon domain-containing protein [Treponema sp.]